MKNLWKGAVALVLFGAASMPMASGCVEAEAPFFVRTVKAQGCGTVTVDGPFLSLGRMDLRYSCDYLAVIELGNQLVRRADETKLQVETSRISVNALDVQIFQADGETLVNQFTYPTAGFVDPATGANPGRGLAGALLIDGATAFMIAERGPGIYVVRVVAHGRTLGGDDITSRPFDFPIDVCIGCLCNEPTNDDCVVSEGSPSEQCFFPQDREFDCRWLKGHECDEAAACGCFGPDCPQFPPAN